MGEEFEIIGKRIPRIEAIPKVTGSIKYLADMAFPGMLHAKFLRSPYAHAMVVSIDTSKAEKLPGVKLVLTPDDIIGKVPPVGMLTLPKNQYALHREVRYVGDEVAAVAAEDEETAEEAVGLIEVTYEELPFVFDPEKAMSPGAPQLHEEPRNIREPKKVRVGNVEEGFSQADHVFKARFKTSKQSHVCLDIHACISSYDAATGKLTHWTPTQFVFTVRLDLAEVLNMPASKVRVIVPQAIGGAFGSRCGTFPYDMCAALMSRRLGRPVKFVLSREEEFTATRTRHPFVIESEVGLKRDGTITAWRQKNILDMGAYADWGPITALLAQGMMALPYKIPNIWVDSYPVYTNKPVSGAFAGFGNPQITFARESLLDIAARQIGISPLELRLKNIVKSEETPYTTSQGQVVRSCGMEECLKKVSEAVGWGEEGKPGTGIGLACTAGETANKVIDADFGSAEVEVAADGSLIVRTGNSDIGQGLYTTLAMVASEELGVPMDKVIVVGADSEGTPPDLGCYAARSLLVTGGAVKRAAAEAKEKLLRVAGNMLEVDPQDLVAKQGKIYVKDMSREVDIKEVAGAAYFTSIDGDAGPVTGQGIWASPTVPQDENGYGNFMAACIFAAHAAKVEVDSSTGEVKIVKYAVAHDVGRVINVTAVEGELQGRAGMGIGFGVLECTVYDGKTGKLLSPSIMSYRTPTSVDLPDIETFIVEAIDPGTPFGNKGAAQTALVCPAAAIANAIHDAVGVSIKDLPITPEKLLRGQQENTSLSGQE